LDHFKYQYKHNILILGLVRNVDNQIIGKLKYRRLKYRQVKNFDELLYRQVQNVDKLSTCTKYRLINQKKIIIILIYLNKLAGSVHFVAH